MTRGEIDNDHSQLNAQDQEAFRRWGWTNMVFGAVSLIALIAVASMYSGDGQNAATVKNVHAEAK